MHTEFSRRAARIMALTAGSLLLPQLALAQGVPLGSPSSPAASGLIRPNRQPENKVAPPPALPGAASHETAAPAAENASDMSPNAALFDAINRGDIAGVRGALNRGAILSAHNDLGLTPIELAVDLGRHDILFLLLSVRGADSGGGSPPAVQQAAAKQAPAPGKPKHPAKVVVRRATPAPAAPQPKLFANDGGAPIPSIGFLGFGNGRASP